MAGGPERPKCDIPGAGGGGGGYRRGGGLRLRIRVWEEGQFRER